MTTELIWFLMPLSSLLWAAGGTWNKNIRRFGVPSAVLAFLLCHPSAGVIGWWFFPLILFFHLVTRLPLTLYGDDVKDHFFNWFWFWCVGIFYALPFIFLAIPLDHVLAWAFSILPVVFATGSCLTLSNIPLFRHIVVHKFCEVLIGAAVVYPVCLLVQTAK